MAPPSLRDRFFTPPVARAITAPTTLLVAAGSAAVVLLAGGGAPIAVALAIAAFAARVALAIPRPPRPERIDPFTVAEPWRHYVQDALQARNRFRDAVDGAREGPLRDRLREIDDRVETGVREVWRIARRGHELVDARRRVDPGSIRREMAAIPSATDDPTAQRTRESLRSQLATAERLEAVIRDADSRLRLLDARLGEAAARTIELSVRAHDVAELGGVGRDVDDVVDEMEALRLAIEETGGGTAVAGPT